MKPALDEPIFFATPAALREWLEKHHADRREQWVGFYKKRLDKPSITWPESVDEALCFGWIDGLRKTIDAQSYKIRFSPRKTTSIWSTINIHRAQELARQGRMRPAGVKAFAARKENKSGIYSYKQRRDQLEEPYHRMLRKNKNAWDFFQAQPPGYRRQIGWWIVSAKQEETRLKRLEKLIETFSRGKRL